MDATSELTQQDLTGTLQTMHLGAYKFFLVKRFFLNLNNNKNIFSEVLVHPSLTKLSFYGTEEENNTNKKTIEI